MKKLRYTAAFAAVLLLTLIGNSIAQQRSEPNDNDTVPAGEWSVSGLPYMGKGYEALPVRVYSVTTSSVKGLKINKVGVVNQTSKPVVGIKFKWELANRSDSDKALLKGETPLVGVAIAEETRKTVEFPVLSFGKISKPLLKGDALQGSYDIIVAISEILYEDGTIWKWGDASVIPVNLIPLTQICAYQKCDATGKGKEILHTYLITDVRIYCRNEGTSCSNITC